MRLTSKMLLAMAVGAMPLASIAATFNFDDFTVTGGTSFAAASRYQSMGAVFSRDIPIYNVAVAAPGILDGFINLGGTSPNALVLNNPLGSQIDVTFVVPGTFTAATTDTVQALFYDTEVGSTLGTIQAFDANNVLLASQSLTTPASFGAVLQVSAAGIARVRFSVDDDGALLDNLVFAPVPEPTSAILISIGLAAFVLSARRKRSGRSDGAVRSGRLGSATSG